MKFACETVLFLIVCFGYFPMQEAKRGDGKDRSGLGLDIRPKKDPSSRRMLKCMGEDINKEAMITAMDSCDQEMSLNPGMMRKDKMNLCYTSCVWKNLGLVNEEMMFTEDVTPFVTSTFPSAAQAMVVEAMINCAKMSTSPFTMDNNCMSYKMVRACIMKSVMKICKT